MGSRGALSFGAPREGVVPGALRRAGVCPRVGLALRGTAGAVCGVPAARRGLLGAATGAGYGTGKKFPVALGNESGRRERCLPLRQPPGSSVRRPPSQAGAPMDTRVAACPAVGEPRSAPGEGSAWGRGRCERGGRNSPAQLGAERPVPTRCLRSRGGAALGTRKGRRTSGTGFSSSCPRVTVSVPARGWGDRSGEQKGGGRVGPCSGDSPGAHGRPHSAQCLPH